MMVIVFVFSVCIGRLRSIFPFPKSNSASQYANDDWQRPTSIVDLTAREPCRTFTFAKHVSFEHSTGIPCPVISSRREGNINKRTKLKSFLTLDRRSVSPHRPACVRALRGQWAIWLAPRLSLATESTGTVLIPSQMSEIAGHGIVRAHLPGQEVPYKPKAQDKCLLQSSQLCWRREMCVACQCVASLSKYKLMHAWMCVLVCAAVPCCSITHCDFKLALTRKSRPCRGTLRVLMKQIAA